MPHYFFDIHDGLVARDTAGQELPDFAVARAWAMQVAGAYASRPGRVGEIGGVAVVTVRDQLDRELLKVRLVFDVEDLRSHAERDGRL